MAIHRQKITEYNKFVVLHDSDTIGDPRDDDIIIIAWGKENPVRRGSEPTLFTTTVIAVPVVE